MEIKSDSFKSYFDNVNSNENNKNLGLLIKNKKQCHDSKFNKKLLNGKNIEIIEFIDFDNEGLSLGEDPISKQEFNRKIKNEISDCRNNLNYGININPFPTSNFKNALNKLNEHNYSPMTPIEIEIFNNNNIYINNSMINNNLKNMLKYKYSICIGNIPKILNEKLIKEIFSKFGNIISVEVKNFKFSNL